MQRVRLGGTAGGRSLLGPACWPLGPGTAAAGCPLPLRWQPAAASSKITAKHATIGFEECCTALPPCLGLQPAAGHAIVPKPWIIGGIIPRMAGFVQRRLCGIVICHDEPLVQYCRLPAVGIAMGWLVSAKVLPPLMLGDPPSYRTIAYARSYRATVGWKVLVNGKQIGSAVSTAVKTADGSTEDQESRPLRPPSRGRNGAARAAGLVGPVMAPQAGSLKMDSESTLTVDAEGRLTKLPLGVARAVDPQRRAALRPLRRGATDTDDPHRPISPTPPTPICRPTRWPATRLSPQACLPGLAQGRPGRSPPTASCGPCIRIPWKSSWRPSRARSGSSGTAARGRLAGGLSAPTRGWASAATRPRGAGSGSAPTAPSCASRSMLLASTLTFVRLSPRQSAAGDEKAHDR